MEAVEQEMGARWQGMGGWRHLVRTRLEHCLPSGGWAISRMSGNTRPGREAATPMVTRLALWCTYTGAPRLVTWGSRERGWDHSFLLCSAGTSTQSSPTSPPAALCPPGPKSPNPGGLPSLLPLSAPRAQGARDLDKVTLEHGQRAEGQVLALLEGLLQLPQGGDPLQGSLEWLQTPDVPEPVHDGCRKCRSPGARRQGAGPSPSGFSGSRGWGFPRAWTWPCRGAQPWPGGGAVGGGAL